MRKIMALALCCACVFSISCKSKNGGSADGKITVGLVMKTYEGPYFVSMVETFKSECAKKGWPITVLSSNEDITKEAENMESLIAKKVKMIFLDSVDPAAAVPNVDKAAAAGIGVINVDSSIDEIARDVTTIYSNNKENGREVGLAYIRKIGMDKPVVAILLAGNKGNVAGEERRTGLFAGILQGRLNLSPDAAWNAAVDFNKTLIANGKAENVSAKFQVVGMGWGAWTKGGGLNVAGDLITANKNINCMMGENDQMLLGAREALIAAGLVDKVDIIAAADGAKEAYDLIKDPSSHYVATGENSPTKVSLKAMEIAEEILVQGKDMWSYPEIITTEAVAVTSENVSEHYDYGF